MQGPDQSESEIYDDSNPPTWIEALEAYLGDQVQEATYEVKVERVYDPESGLIIERIIDPLSKDSGLIMELVYDPETNEVQLTAVFGGGGGWGGSIISNVFTWSGVGSSTGTLLGAKVGGLIGAGKGSISGIIIGSGIGVGVGIYKHWRDYHKNSNSNDGSVGDRVEP